MPRTTKHLIEETEDDSKKWKDSPCSQTGRINKVKMAILPNVINRCLSIHIRKLSPLCVCVCVCVSCLVMSDSLSLLLMMLAL